MRGCVEPPKGFEPLTPALQVRRSTPELRRRAGLSIATSRNPQQQKNSLKELPTSRLAPIAEAIFR